jgi:hypothetical protein
MVALEGLKKERKKAHEKTSQTALKNVWESKNVLCFYFRVFLITWLAYYLALARISGRAFCR